MPYTYEYFQKSADYVKSKIDFTPEIAIILGSCLGPFAQQIEGHPQLPGLHCGVPRRKAHFRHRLRPQGGVHVRPVPLL